MFVKRTIFLLLLSLADIFLPGCATHNIQDARNRADNISHQAHFKKTLLKTQSFTFLSYQKQSKDSEILTIYIEGDGRSRISRTRVSADPTPINPLALKLAVLDPSPKVAYLARPCQYTAHHLSPACTPEIWSNARFSETVVSQMNAAIEILKTNTKTKYIHLVGFSGGGAIATLIAARRQDVLSLKTVAGDLDHAALSHYHKTTPLYDSLNPKAVAYQLKDLPQIHFSGEKDSVVPTFIADEFTAEIIRQGGRHAKAFVLKGATHHEGWEKNWLTLLGTPL